MLENEPQHNLFTSLNFTILCGLLFGISFIGLFIPIMEVDAAQYALMSLEMLENRSFLSVTDLGIDYLDKPPLLFWLSSCSIALFGNTGFAFKLPSFILAWLSVYFLYRLALLYYSYSIARLSVLLYAGSVAFILFTNDVRTDTLMISFVVFAVWQLALYFEKEGSKHLLLGTIGIGFAMLAKGPIGAVIPLLAIGPHVLLKGKLNKLFNWKMLLVPIIILIVLSPMLYGLYDQWGEHGLRFYFWEQSFGRITGENVWQNDATHFYFLHNIAWAFLPFTLFLLLGLIFQFKSFKNQKEYISLFGFVLPFIALSFSQYKLPHYIYVVVPFAAIIAGKHIHYWLRNEHKVLDGIIGLIQAIIITALTVLPILLMYIFPSSKILYVIYIVGLAFIIYTFVRTKTLKTSLLFASIFSFLFSVFYLNVHGYPQLLKYQASSEAGKYISQSNIAKDELYQLDIWWRAFHYYSGQVVPEFTNEILEEKAEVFVYTDEEGYTFLEENYSVEMIKTFPHFNITRLSIPFLNPSSREKYLSFQYLIKIKKHHEENL